MILRSDYHWNASFHWQVENQGHVLSGPTISGNWTSFGLKFLIDSQQFFVKMVDDYWSFNQFSSIFFTEFHIRQTQPTYPLVTANKKCFG